MTETPSSSAALLAQEIAAYQAAASTALAELRLFVETGDNDHLHSFMSWSVAADSERDNIKRKVGW